MPGGEFGRSKLLAAPCVCVEIGYKRASESVEESGESDIVKFEDSVSE